MALAHDHPRLDIHCIRYTKKEVYKGPAGVASAKKQVHKGARYGRNKENRNDCKIVGMAAVVNTDGLLVRTEIFEGNRQDVTTLEEVIGSLKNGLSDTRKIIVMDAGFSSESNLEWLRNHHYEYITVARSQGLHYDPESDVVVKVTDNKKQGIRLQKVKGKGLSYRLLLVDSDAKAAKERSMEQWASARYEEALQVMRKGIEGKGTKLRDALQRRLGKLQSKYPNASKAYDVTFTYDGDRATGMEYARNTEYAGEISKMHGKYLLRTTLSETEERVLSTRQYNLKRNGINFRWNELLRIMSTRVRVTAEFETDPHHRVSIRKSTDPEEKLSAIYDALRISSTTRVVPKSVVHPKQLRKKITQ